MPPTTSPAIRLGLAAVLVLAAAVRVGCWLLFDDPMEGALLRDAAVFDAWARDLVAGRPEPAPYWGDPLYAWLLAAWYRLGLGPEQVLLAQGFLDVVHVAVVFFLARRVLGDPRPALVAAGLAALYEPYAYFAAALLKNSTSALALDAALLLVLWALERRRGLPALAAGWALGVAALLRPNVLLLAPGLAALALWRDRRDAPRRGLTVAAGLCAGALLGVAPATWHNITRGGEAVLINASWGVNLYLGNHPHAPHAARLVSPPGIQSDPLIEAEVWAREAARRSGRRMTIGAEQRWWAGQALAFIREAPGAAAVRAAHKLLLLWNVYEVPDNRNLVAQRERTPWPLRGPLPLIGFALVAPLAAAGLVLVRRDPRARRDVEALVVVIAIYTLSVVPFTVNARYRILLAGPLLPFAGLAAWRALRGRGAGASRRGVVAALATAAVLVNLPLEEPGPDLARDRYDEAVHLFEQGRPAEALSVADAALTLDPGLTLTHLVRAAALTSLGRDAETEAACRAGIRSGGVVAGLAWLELGRLHQRRGELERARAAYLEATRTPGLPAEAERDLRERLARPGR